LIPPGHYGIPDNDVIIDLGTSIDIIPFAKRPKALDTSDKTATVTSYDAECEVFRDIAARSKIKDSGCQHGTSFLVWERSTAQFLELWFGSPSSRPEAKNVFDYCPLTPADYAAMEARGEDMTDVEVHGPRPLSMKVRLAENDKQQTWHVPQAAKCSAVFTKLPSVEEASADIVRFMSVKSEGVEKVKEPEGKSKRKR
jgi:hypothetical protein